MPNANNRNTRNCSETNGQVHSNQHSNTNILIISCDTLLNQPANYVWKCEQYLKFYNDIAYTSTVQIFNNESVLLKIEIIRIFQSALVTNPNHSQAKMLSMNMIISTSCISSTIYKLTRKAVTLSILTTGEVEEMICTSLSNKACNNQERVCLRSIVQCTTLPRAETATINTICSRGRFIFPTSLAIQSNQITISKFAGYFENIVQCCNCDYAVPLLNGKWMNNTYFDTLSSHLQLLVQTVTESLLLPFHRPKNIAFNDRGTVSANEETGRQRIRRSSRSWYPYSFMQISAQFFKACIYIQQYVSIAQFKTSTISLDFAKLFSFCFFCCCNYRHYYFVYYLCIGLVMAYSVKNNCWNWNSRKD
ncbi:hypothetical protein RFI_37296 [Reticulomyxa filosa]|uniref:Uncharacterized protein n=1 Tax=Reticulomyxa filosa TaxID=46433 RepID=X6LDS7_RETFI|nr:hypothetical protein RFI_37296 [Reticulomyxa filosa]|eukprot:ETO00163.1 hypothetical protein RFI_37296 [Reticulomyxa filosa]